VPFHWIKTDAIAPNPGRWTKHKVHEIVEDKHGGKLKAFLRDADGNCVYVLVKDAHDPEQLRSDLYAKEMIELHEVDDDD
jgi:hypothetical protein